MASGMAYHLTRPSYEMLEPSTMWRRRRSRKVTRSNKPSRNKADSEPTSTGCLGSLPLEIIHKLLMALDLESVSAVRRLHSCYRSLVDSLPAYRILKDNARQTLRVMHETKVASQWSFGQIYAEFCYPRCRTCSDFGAYIFLPTCSRCCYNCLFSRREYEIAHLSHVKAIFALSEDALGQLVILENIPSIPFWYGVDSCPRPQVVSVQQAFELAIEIHGDMDRMGQAAQRCNRKWRKEWRKHSPCYTSNGSLAEEIAANTTACSSIGPGLPGHNFCYTVDGRLIEKPPWLRELKALKQRILEQYDPSEAPPMGSTFFPFWDKRTQKAEPGMYCSACSYLWERMPDCDDETVLRQFRRAYLPDEIPIHFQNCSGTQKGDQEQDWFQLWRALTYTCTSPEFLVSEEGKIVKLTQKRPKKKTKNKWKWTSGFISGR